MWIFIPNWRNSRWVCQVDCSIAFCFHTADPSENETFIRSQVKSFVRVFALNSISPNDTNFVYENKISSQYSLQHTRFVNLESRTIVIPAILRFF